MEIKERIAKIMSNEKLSATHFADRIGVQRSSISHVLSGRNKPSLDYLQKILRSFPNYNAEWLIMGIGELSKLPIKTNLFSKPSSPITENRTIETVPVIENTKKITNVTKDLVPPETELIIEKEIKNHGKPNEKEVEKIVIFYNDGTFRAYKPSL